MHKYFRAIGDYAKDTRHLSMIEHGAYTLMLDICYASEKPLPDDLPALFRLCCARSKTEQEAVENVLREFFTLTIGGGWTQKRVLKELSDYSGTSDSRRYAVFCRMWAKEFKKKRQIVDYESWTNGLEEFFETHPTIKRESIDYQLMVVWYANVYQPRTSNQEPVTKNQEPVFPPDYPAGHVAALSRWWNYKREMRQTYKPTGWETLLNQQAVYTADQVQRSVEASIASNYAGLFTDKIAAIDSRNQQGQKKEGAAGGVKSWATRRAEADQAQEDELATLPQLPRDDLPPEWAWQSVAQFLYGASWEDWSDVPEDARRELSAEWAKNKGGAQS